MLGSKMFFFGLLSSVGREAKTWVLMQDTKPSQDSSPMAKSWYLYITIRHLPKADQGQ
jgi:hypothetical protein